MIIVINVPLLQLAATTIFVVAGVALALGCVYGSYKGYTDGYEQRREDERDERHGL